MNARTGQPAWHLLVISLPGRHGTARMRVWRALKTAGAVVLRDGVYLLPAGGSAVGLFQAQAREVSRAGGTAYVFDLERLETEQEEAFRALFDRGADYARLIEALRALRSRVGYRRRRALPQAVRRLRREYETLRATDYFPGAAAAQAAQLLAESQAMLETLSSPGEPTAADAAIERRVARDYRGRSWATRQRPWIDRLASAWLIKRFIDPKARILWLKDTRRCPKSALGFDFDGATFSHVGSRVTFEVLATSFGLEHEPALARLAALVHFLDVGGAPVAEAAGVALALNGARARLKNDDALLAQAGRLFDDLYAAFSET